MIYNTRQKIGYVRYHAYLFKKLVISNMDIFSIHNIVTRKINIKTTSEYLSQFQLAYICYSRLHMNEKIKIEI